MAAETLNKVVIPWRPFGWATLLWLSVAGLLAFEFAEESSVQAVKWVIALGFVCTLDLVATAQVFASVFPLMSSEESAGKNRTECLIRASSWGSIKLVCWGLIATQLLQGRSIPTSALLLGLATLIVVPILGGAAWYRRTSRI